MHTEDDPLPAALQSRAEEFKAAVSQLVELLDLNHPSTARLKVIICMKKNIYVAGINTRLSIASSSGGREIRPVSVLLVLFSVYTIEILGRGNQPWGWEIPLLPTL